MFHPTFNSPPCPPTDKQSVFECMTGQLREQAADDAFLITKAKKYFFYNLYNFSIIPSDKYLENESDGLTFCCNIILNLKFLEQSHFDDVVLVGLEQCSKMYIHFGTSPFLAV